MAQAHQLLPEDHVKLLQRHTVEGDLAAMMKDIAELHLHWTDLSEGSQAEVKKLEGIFLTMLKAKAAGARA